ncbi:MAG: molybdopterin-dependent oxidoreductase, partial [Anaerolineales bacterium]|nr:molybdopterin-dependent oxidoreductase [Anaerolineales bacterium]
IAHRIRRAAQKGATLVVANPKEIDLCRSAHTFLQLRPGSDIALLMGMARVIVDEALYDEAFIREYCEDFEALTQSLAQYTPEFVAEMTGVPSQEIASVARLYATNRPGGIFFAMGIAQHTHGTDNVNAISNLALLTGNVGKPSSGVNPLRGQNNVQGACDMGGLPNVYPGYQRVDNPQVRQKFEAAWNCELDDRVGLTHTEIIDAIDEGKIKALYVVGENPALSEANATHATAALQKLDFLVVQDIFFSASAEYADVVLPAASFAEKDGTFTNTERRVQRVRRAIEPIGESKSDWWIVAQIAQRMGAVGFDFNNAREIMAEVNTLTPSYAGITYERLAHNGGLQWPCPAPDHPGTQYLHAGGFARGKGKFMSVDYRPSDESPDEEYPLLLTTDRSLFHWHFTMTHRVAGLQTLNSEELLLINPKDAAQLNIASGAMVEIASRRGEVAAKAKITDRCPPGVVSMTFHFQETPTNVITNPALDPVAKVPETKVAAVRVTTLP